MAVELDDAAKKRVSAAVKDATKVAKLKSAAELHSFADQWNWDDGVEPLLAVIADARCDRATAQLIYWRAEPIEYFVHNTTPKQASKDYGPGAYDAWKLFEAAEKRFAANDFASAGIAFDPHDDDGADQAEGWDDPEMARPIPPALAEPTGG
jgi:hypothetical protein